MNPMLPSTIQTASATQITDISMLNNSGHTHHYRRFAYPLAGIHARLVEICDWLHLHTTGLAPATFHQLTWRSWITCKIWSRHRRRDQISCNARRTRGISSRESTSISISSIGTTPRVGDQFIVLRMIQKIAEDFSKTRPASHKNRPYDAFNAAIPDPASILREFLKNLQPLQRQTPIQKFRDKTRREVPYTPIPP